MGIGREYSHFLCGARTLDRLELRCGTTENDVLGVGDKVEHRVQPVEHQIEAARAQAEEAVVMEVRGLEHDTGAEEAKDEGAVAAE